MLPTQLPTSQPSGQPSVEPTEQPSELPSADPTGQPSAEPSVIPTGEPSQQPSANASCVPIKLKKHCDARDWSGSTFYIFDRNGMNVYSHTVRRWDKEVFTFDYCTVMDGIYSMTVQPPDGVAVTEKLYREVSVELL